MRYTHYMHIAGLRCWYVCLLVCFCYVWRISLHFLRYAADDIMHVRHILLGGHSEWVAVNVAIVKLYFVTITTEDRSIWGLYQCMPLNGKLVGLLINNIQQSSCPVVIDNKNSTALWQFRFSSSMHIYYSDFWEISFSIWKLIRSSEATARRVKHANTHMNQMQAQR